MHQPNNDEKVPKLVIIVGAGLVGALAALYFAEAGWTVHLIEQRNDLRKEPHSRTRSINLALSHRGIQALRQLKCIDINTFLDIAIPMNARMIHSRTGAQNSQAYGLHGECIYSIDRCVLNERLLDYAEALPLVKFFFNHDIRTVHFDNKNKLVTLTVCNKETGIVTDLVPDLLIGADGAHSFIRNQLSRPSRMSIKQEFIDHGYLELTLPSRQNNPDPPSFHLNEKHLHIWPRETFMMIGLPNPDKSFTCTIFAPWSILNRITTKDQVKHLFETQFSDVIALIPDFDDQFLSNPKGPLISIKCHPYHFEDKVIIIGDAAHAMVPFYGQGMNCGFEDVQVLFEIFARYQVFPIKKQGSTFDPTQADALAFYTDSRHKDLTAMVDLAFSNYEEMRASVANPIFLAQRFIERALGSMFPSLIVPLYSSVAFTSIPYAQCMQRGLQLRQVAMGILTVTGVLSILGIVSSAAFLLKHRSIAGSIRK